MTLPVQALNAAFHALEDLPFAVHRLARPEVDDFLSLLGGRAVSIIPAVAEQAQVCERLVQLIHGKQIAATGSIASSSSAEPIPLFARRADTALADSPNDNLPPPSLAISCRPASVTNLPTVRATGAASNGVFGDAVPSAGVQKLVDYSAKPARSGYRSATVRTELSAPHIAGSAAPPAFRSIHGTSSVARRPPAFVTKRQRARCHRGLFSLDRRTCGFGNAKR